MTTTTTQTSAAPTLRDAIADRYVPGPAPFKRVALTPAQAREWDLDRSRFLSHCPAFAHVLYTMMSYSDGELAWFTDDARIPVAATDGARLILNAKAYFGYHPLERVFIIAHEVLHAVMDHCAQGYRFARARSVSYADGTRLPYAPELMNVALDLVINDLLAESGIGQLPRNCWRDKRLGKFDDEALTVYRNLYKAAGGSTPQGNGQSGFDVLLEPGQLAGQDAQGNAGQSPGQGASMTPEQAMSARSEVEWKTAVAAGMASARLQGKLPGALDRVLGDIVDPQVSWQDKIQALFARKVGTGGYDWRRPERQLISRPFLQGVTREVTASDAVFAPGRSGKGVDCVVVAVDTSGSIGDREVTAFFSEMAGIIEDCRPRRLVVMWCDAKVQRVDEVEEAADLALLRKKGAPGGGGTAFEPVFAEVVSMGLEPAALVYLTDGMGSFPDRAPAYPVIWGSIYAKPDHYKFGDVVEIKL